MPIDQEDKLSDMRPQAQPLTFRKREAHISTVPQSTVLAASTKTITNVARENTDND